MYNPKEGWTPNWSGSGIAILDNMERVADKIHSTQRNQVSQTDRLMLSTLLRNAPNKFYKSLALQLFEEGGLTTKQIQCIHTGYEKLQTVVN